jgi:hypothetical protein
MNRLLGLAVLAVAISGTPAAAFQGMDLVAFGARAETALGPGYRARPPRVQGMMIACAGCGGPTFITVDVARRADGEAAALRDGRTTTAELLARCQATEPSCQVERADIGGAVGVLSTFRGAPASGASLVLLHGDDRLVIRSTAPTLEQARASLDLLMRDVVPAFVPR